MPPMAMQQMAATVSSGSAASPASRHRADSLDISSSDDSDGSSVKTDDSRATIMQKLKAGKGYKKRKTAKKK